MKIDRIVRSRRKTISLIIHKDGSVEVRAPLRTSDRQIMQFVNSKQDWINQKQALVLENLKKLPVHNFTKGETFFFLGERYKLELVPRKKPLLSLEKAFLLSDTCQERLKAEEVFSAWYREQAQAVLADRVLFFARQYGFKQPLIRITAAQTRWGSCSSRGSLNFTWRLVQAPLEIIDYVVVHELCHMKEHNHSRAFWALVAEILPDFQKRRKWLKENGYLFQSF